DAADVEAYAAERAVALDERRAHPEIRRTEGCGVAARPRTEHEHFAVDFGGAVGALLRIGHELPTRLSCGGPPRRRPRASPTARRSGARDPRMPPWAPRS